MKLVTTAGGAVHALAVPYGDGGEARCTLDAAGPVTDGAVRDVTCRQCQGDLRRAGWRQRWPVVHEAVSS